jgi:hypothetical protein
MSALPILAGLAAGAAASKLAQRPPLGGLTRAAGPPQAQAQPVVPGQPQRAPGRPEQLAGPSPTGTQDGPTSATLLAAPAEGTPRAQEGGERTAAPDTGAGADGAGSPGVGLLLCHEEAAEALRRGSPDNALRTAAGAGPGVARQEAAVTAAPAPASAAIRVGASGAGGFIKLLPQLSRAAHCATAREAPSPAAGASAVAQFAAVATTATAGAVRGSLQVVFRIAPPPGEHPRPPPAAPAAPTAPALRQLQALHGLSLRQAPSPLQLREQRTQRAQQRRPPQHEEQTEALKLLLQAGALMQPSPQAVRGARAVAVAGVLQSGSGDDEAGNGDGLDAQQLKLIEQLLGPPASSEGQRPVHRGPASWAQQQQQEPQQRQQQQQQQQQQQSQEPVRARRGGHGGAPHAAPAPAVAHMVAATSEAAAEVRVAWRRLVVPAAALDGGSSSPGTLAAKEAEAAAHAAAATALALPHTVGPSADQQHWHG